MTLIETISHYFYQSIFLGSCSQKCLTCPNDTVHTDFNNIGKDLSWSSMRQKENDSRIQLSKTDENMQYLSTSGATSNSLPSSHYDSQREQSQQFHKILTAISTPSTLLNLYLGHSLWILEMPKSWHANPVVTSREQAICNFWRIKFW
jgi:hypothetical protein